jgi:1,2-phenylacetyl-CoA epoxidase catalytic subunit
MWAERLRDEPRFRAALDELWPYALGMLPEELRPELARRLDRPCDNLSQGVVRRRGSQTAGFAELWDEMTMVRRSAPGAEW